MDCVNIICNKYNIDKSDAVRVLVDEGIKLKTTIKHFPWNGVPNNDCCEGLKYCGGLFIQCKNKKTEGSENYCSFCFKQSEQNEHGKPNCGNIQDRMKVSPLEYIDPKGRKVVPFSTYMRKKKIDRELAEIEASINNIKIAEDQYTEVVVKRGRPKKNDTDKTKVTGEKKRGRPKKNNKVENTENAKETEDVVEAIINKSNDEVNDDASEQQDKSEDETMDHCDSDSEDTSEIEVEVIEYRGVTYYLAASGEVYNETSDMLGHWNKTTKEIDFIET